MMLVPRVFVRHLKLSHRYRTYRLAPTLLFVTLACVSATIAAACGSDDEGNSASRDSQGMSRLFGQSGSDDEGDSASRDSQGMSRLFGQKCEQWPVGTDREIVAYFRDVSSGTIEKCLESGADPNEQHGSQSSLIPGWSTPLHLVATYNDDPTATRALVEGGAHLDQRTVDCWTPTHFAAGYNKNSEVVAELARAGANVDSGDWSGPYPTVILRTHCASDEEGIPWTPLHMAVRRNNDPEVITVLAEAGANPNSASRTGHAPLHVAAIFAGNPAIMTTLVKAGADPNLRSQDGYAPLYLAAQHSDNPEIIKALIKAGADPNSRTAEGHTPLHTAAVDNHNPGIITALVEGGADPNLRDPDSWTPLHHAARRSSNPKVVMALLDAGADPQLTISSGHTAFHIASESNTALRGTEAYQRLEDGK